MMIFLVQVWYVRHYFQFKSDVERLSMVVIDLFEPGVYGMERSIVTFLRLGWLDYLFLLVLLDCIHRAYGGPHWVIFFCFCLLGLCRGLIYFGYLHPL